MLRQRGGGVGEPETARFKKLSGSKRPRGEHKTREEAQRKHLQSVPALEREERRRMPTYAIARQVEKRTNIRGTGFLSFPIKKNRSITICSSCKKSVIGGKEKYT